MSSKRNVTYKCLYCDKRFNRSDLVDHIGNEHEGEIPKDFTPLRLVFNYVNNKPLSYHGKCTECGKSTPWDENKGRYDRQCGSKACHDSYVKKFENNMMKTRGTTRISATVEGQKKMLASRRISGKYKMSDGALKEYCGSYELKALMFMDKVLQVKSDDIMCPGPILEYTYEGKTHIYITDFYYQPYNLIIEVKDGGDNPNKRNMPEYRGKQIAKEEFIVKHTNYNYIRLTNNNLEQLLNVFVDLKMQLIENTGERVIHINENLSLVQETVSKLNKNYKSKGKKSLSSFKRVHLTDNIIDKYKTEYPFLKYVRCKDTDEYICDGYIWFDNDALVCMVGSCEYLDDNTKWIVSLEITKDYRGYNLSKQILDFATKIMNCKNLSVNKNNNIAKKVYDDYGFKTYQESETMYYMTIDKSKNMNEDALLESAMYDPDDKSTNIYNISEQDIDGKVLRPRIPDNYMTKNGYEDNTTKRVSFSKSIDGCLMGLSENCDNKQYNVYIPAEKHSIYTPTVRQVPDCEITKEVWIKDPVKLKKIGTIIAHDSGKPGIKYKYGNNTAELYPWDYEWIDKVNESINIVKLIESTNIEQEYVDYSILNRTIKQRNLYPIYLVLSFNCSLFNKLIQITKNDTFSHAGLSFHSKLDTIYTFGPTGFTEDTLDIYMKKSKGEGKLKVLAIFVDKNTRDKLLDNVMYYYNSKDKTKYNFVGIMRCLFNLKANTSMGNLKMICSEFTNLMLRMAGINLVKDLSTNLTRPDSFRYAINDNPKIYDLYDGYTRNYNDNIVNNLVYNLVKSNKRSTILISESLTNGIDKINEGYILNNKDIYWNQDNFNSAKINLCFITGLSGSGKSTLAHSLETDNIEIYELDDVIYNKAKFSMENLKEYGDLIYSFFNTIGKKYYYTEEDIKNGNTNEYGDNYDKDLITDFVGYSIKYSKIHKNKRFILEGVQIFYYISPGKIEEYAVYIKGTSALLSVIRGAKRNNNGANNLKFHDRIKIWKEQFIHDINTEKKLMAFYNYYKKLQNVNESYSQSIIDEIMSQISTAPVVGLDSSNVYITNNLQSNAFNNDDIDDKDICITDGNMNKYIKRNSKTGILEIHDLTEHSKDIVLYRVYNTTINEVYEKIKSYIGKPVSKEFLFESCINAKQYVFDQYKLLEHVDLHYGVNTSLLDNFSKYLISEDKDNNNNIDNILEIVNSLIEEN